MCLGVPGKILKKWQEKPSNIWMAKVDFDGIKKEICLALNKDAKIGEYVLVHVGFAISKIDAIEAEKSLTLIKQMGTLEEEIEPEKLIN